MLLQTVESGMQNRVLPNGGAAISQITQENENEKDNTATIIPDDEVIHIHVMYTV